MSEGVHEVMTIYLGPTSSQHISPDTPTHTYSSRAHKATRCGTITSGPTPQAFGHLGSAKKATLSDGPPKRTGDAEPWRLRTRVRR